MAGQRPGNFAARARVGRSRTTTVDPPSWWSRATLSLCMDRLDRSQVEIKASRDTRTGFITLDHSCKKNPKRPQIEACRRNVQEIQRIRVLGYDNRPFLLCLPSCCRSVSGLRRPVIVVFLTCFPRVPDSASEAVIPLNHHQKSRTSGPGRPNMHQKTAITRDFRLKAETGSLQTPCTATT